MNSRDLARYEAQSKVFKAMAHPTRLFLIQEIAQGDKCVCDLTQMVGADVSTVSKHLSVLKNAGILKDTKRGAQVIYTLCMPCVLNFLRCVESVLNANVQKQFESIVANAGAAEEEVQ